jgi:hypothetical protein
VLKCFGLNRRAYCTVFRMEPAPHLMVSKERHRPPSRHLLVTGVAIVLLGSCATKTTLPAAPDVAPISTTATSTVATSPAVSESSTSYSVVVSQDRVTRVRPVLQKSSADSSAQLSQQPVADLITPGDGYTYQLGPAILESQLFSEVLVTNSSATEATLSFRLNSDGLAEMLWQSASTECAGSRDLCPTQELAVFSGDVFAFQASLQDLTVSSQLLQLTTRLKATQARSIAGVFI